MSIAELRTRVAETTGADRILNADVLRAFGWTTDGSDLRHPDGHRVFRVPDCTGSVDDALALVEQKLPGWGVTITVALGGQGCAEVFHRDGRTFDCNGDARISLSEWLDGDSPHRATAPLAILSALLSALAESDRTEKAA